ncbi:hypothetical protein F5J12DRAFT_784221 [Pisolithus orientalis]|uniref:uncharacterized protein n=1 Tax=Pisolithus orientalis TaxID=936130 RepID=UPI002224315E|nr:uncharacterized protein F5J12DRAFT_784221 [Pisolithus orientalis]KAI6000972.1 hypothetical protein F5J12DRAFT_784221 [Pisolithus orientalis]
MSTSSRGKQGNKMKEKFLENSGMNLSGNSAATQINLAEEQSLSPAHLKCLILIPTHMSNKGSVLDYALPTLAASVPLQHTKLAQGWLWPGEMTPNEAQEVHEITINARTGLKIYMMQQYHMIEISSFKHWLEHNAMKEMKKLQDITTNICNDFKNNEYGTSWVPFSLPALIQTVVTLLWGNKQCKWYLDINRNSST